MSWWKKLGRKRAENQARGQLWVLPATGRLPRGPRPKGGEGRSHRERGRERGERPEAYRPLINEEKREIHLTSYRAEILGSFFRSIFKKKNGKKEFG